MNYIARLKEKREARLSAKRDACVYWQTLVEAEEKRHKARQKVDEARKKGLQETLQKVKGAHQKGFQEGLQRAQEVRLGAFSDDRIEFLKFVLTSGKVIISKFVEVTGWDEAYIRKLLKGT